MPISGKLRRGTVDLTKKVEPQQPQKPPGLGRRTVDPPAASNNSRTALVRRWKWKTLEYKKTPPVINPVGRRARGTHEEIPLLTIYQIPLRPWKAYRPEFWQET